MPTWGKGQNGKGSEDRVDLKKYFKNYDHINWGKKAEHKNKSKDKSESV